MIWFNNLIAGLLPLVPKNIVGLFARQYIAGEKLSDAVSRIKKLNSKGIGATIDLLGEDPAGKDQCTHAVKIYQAAIQAIEDHQLDSGVSLKPSHMGLKIDKAFCYENIETIVKMAAKKKIFVRIDMEDIKLKKETIALFLKLKETYDNVGIVMQAYVRKGIEDINEMISHKANIRLCKGAYYWENKKDVFKDMDIINSSYVYLLDKLLTNDCFTAIATHDEKMVFEAMKIIDEKGLSKESYEFQMLYGVADDLRDMIRDSGHRLRIYVPFGEEWFAYSIRRLKENPKMVSYILSNGLKGLFRRS